MTIAQSLQGVSTGATNAGISSSTIFWGVLIVAAVIIAFMLLSSYSRNDRYRGTKGGRVKRVIEYDEEDEELV